MFLSQTDGERLQSIETQLKENEKAEAKASAAEKSAKENIAAEEKKKKQLEKVCLQFLIIRLKSYSEFLFSEFKRR